MALLGGIVLVLGFLGLVKVLNLVEMNKKVIKISTSAIGVVQDPSLDDLQKEKKLQSLAREVFIQFLLILGTSALAVGIPLGLVWLMDVVGLLSFSEVMALISSLWFILAAAALSIGWIFISRRSDKQVTGSDHTKSEMALHDLAFGPWYPRIPLANFESKVYRKKLTAADPRPVFITALPRAGTTLLLELLVASGEFASHTYADMPFLLTPIFWNRFSGNYRKAGDLSERVHGDGILVNENSPESFEEILWKEFWPSYYLPDRIIPWGDKSFPDFEEFFLDHMKKIITLRSGADKSKRYVSKNNLNITRIKYLHSAVDGSKILILFRSPLQHASSLLKQHLNFLNIHREDEFARKYMADTAHFDFGENLRPVDFNRWVSKGQPGDPTTIAFWLEYWIQAYSYLSELDLDRVRFISFDQLCTAPVDSLKTLGQFIDMESLDLLFKAGERISPPTPHTREIMELDPAQVSRAKAIFGGLQHISLVSS